MIKWYAWIDGEYHITRTNISECQCECGKRLSKGDELRTTISVADRLCTKCEERFNPAPIGGQMSLPHYLEGENERLRAENAELRAKLQEMPA